MKTSVKLSEEFEPERVERTKSRLRSKPVLGAFVATFAILLSIGMVAPAATAAGPSGEDAYDLTVNGQTTTLDEGESATFDMQVVQPKTRPGTVSPNVVYPGNGGTITVTASGGVYYWTVATPCAGSFSGTFAITDITSGLSGGYALATGFSGSAPTSKLRGHRYSGSLSGTASNFWGPCAYTLPNNTFYTYTG